MNAITYKALLAVNPTFLKAAGDALQRADQHDRLLTKASCQCDAIDHLAADLDQLVANSAAGDESDASQLEAAVLATFNAPIDTGAKVERPTRDAAYLRRLHAWVNGLVALLDGDPTSEPTDIVPTEEVPIPQN